MVFAGSLWGFGFITTVWALKVFSPSEVLFLRFLIASTVGLCIASLRPQFRCGLRAEILRALPAGLLLGGCMWTQTKGLETTTAAKSGFITTLYVILVPLLEALRPGRKLALQHLANAALALVGILLLTQMHEAKIVSGDLWTLACAVFAAFHILYIDRVSKHLISPFRFNSLQSLFCGLTMVPLLLSQAEIHLLSAEWLPWAGILFLALASSTVAFTIQLRAQKVLPPATASVLFLLESPFALLFGIIFLKEGFNGVQFLGAILIFTAAWRSARGTSAS